MAQSSVIGLLRVLLTANTAEFDSAMAGAAKSTKALTKDLNTFGKHATNVGSSLTAAFTVPIAGLGLAVAKLAIDFEDSFAGVRKTVDASEAEFDQMAQGFRDLSKTIPVNVNELNKLGEAAGALGIPKGEVVDFARVMAELGVTTNLTSDQAADAIARIQNIFGAAGKDTERLASTIVALGNAGASTEKEITEMAQRIAGAGHTVGLTQAQVVSFASTLASVGINAEAGGSAISRIFLKMNDAVAKGGEGMKEFARVAGMSVGKFKETFQKDAASATSAFIEGLGRLKGAGENINATIEGLIGKNIILKDTLFRLSGAGQLLNDQLKIGDQAWRDNTALTIEAGKRFETTSSQMTLLWNRLKDVGITLGKALVPMIRSAIGALDGLLPIVERIGGAFATLPTPIQGLIVGLGLAVAAIGPLIYLFGQLSLSAAGLTAALGLTGAAGSAGIFATALGLLSNPITLTIGALGLLAIAVYSVATAESDLERAARENGKAFKDQTGVLEGALATYERLKTRQHLTYEESVELDKATRLLAGASGLSADAFNREEAASGSLTAELRAQLVERRRLYDEQVKQARAGAIEAVRVMQDAREQLRKVQAREIQRLDFVGDIPTERPFSGKERAAEVQRLLGVIAELEKNVATAEKAYGALTAGVSTDALTFQEWGQIVGKATGAAAAGLKTTGEEAEKTGKKTKHTKTETERLAEALEKMRSDLSGASAITAANQMLDALKGLPPVQNLTVEAQKKINAIMGAAIDVYAGYGLTAPREIGDVYKATLQLGEGIKVVDGITKLSIGGAQTWINTWSSGIPVIEGLGNEIDKIGTKVAVGGSKISGVFGRSLKEGLAKDLNAIPQMLVNAFTGGGDILGGLKAIGSMVGETIGSSIGLALGGPLGKAIGGALGSLAGTLVGWLGKLFGSAGRDAVEAFADTFEGGFDGLHAQLLKGDAAGEALWIKLTQGTGRNNPEQAKKNIAEVTAFLKKLEDAQGAAGKAAETLGAEFAREMEKIAGKYAETLSQIDSERKTLIDRIAGEAPEEFMGLNEIADRARLKELDDQKAAIEAKQKAEEEAERETFRNAALQAGLTLDAIQKIFDKGITIPIKYQLPGAPPPLPTPPPPPEPQLPIPPPVPPEFARGSQGFRDFGRGTLAVLHGTEAVVRPGDMLPGLREPAQVPIHVSQSFDFSGSYIDSERTVEQLTAKVLRGLQTGGQNYSQFQTLVNTVGVRSRR